jgi:hypothetical protein
MGLGRLLNVEAELKTGFDCVVVRFANNNFAQDDKGERACWRGRAGLQAGVATSIQTGVSPSDKRPQGLKASSMYPVARP